MNRFTSHTHLMLSEAAFGRSFCLRAANFAAPGMRQRLKISFVSQKRLFQQNRPGADIDFHAQPRYTEVTLGANRTGESRNDGAKKVF